MTRARFYATDRRFMPAFQRFAPREYRGELESQGGAPIRIGVNGGSINRRKYSHPTPEALDDSAMENIRILKDLNYTNIAVSIESSDVFSTTKQI